jgi:hypothetical protein
MSTVRSPFSGRLITSNFSAVEIVIHQVFTWFALGYVDLHFLFNAIAVEEEPMSHMIISPA